MNTNSVHPARAAFTLIELLVVIAIIGGLVSLLMPAVQSARESARRSECGNNLKQLGLAVSSYENSQKWLPTSDRPPGLTTAPRVSSLIKLLPYLERTNKYDAYDFTKNWHDNTGPEGGNAAIVATRIPSFQCPSTPSAERLDGLPEANPWKSDIASCTDYSPTIGIDARLGPVGHEPAPGFLGEMGLVDKETITYSKGTPPLPNSGLLRKNEKGRLADAKDGLTFTILYAESAGRPYLYRKGTLVGSDLTANRVNGGGWARPGSDFSVDGSTRDGATLPGACAINCTNGQQAAGVGFPLPYYGSEGTGEAYSFHPYGANFVFGDGAVHFLNAEISIREFAKLVARNDGKDITGAGF